MALDAHHFLLSLRTTAGTYVKEWVHGDLGRTQPSVKSMLSEIFARNGSGSGSGGEGGGGTDFSLDITQLDVTWLYDSFRGGGCPPPHGTSSGTTGKGEGEGESEGEGVFGSPGQSQEELSWGNHERMHPTGANDNPTGEEGGGERVYPRMPLESLSRMRLARIKAKPANLQSSS